MTAKLKYMSRKGILVSMEDMERRDKVIDKLKCVLAVFDMWVFYPKFLWNADMFARWHTEQPSIG